MGKRGPPRTPTKILKMRGSWLTRERGNEVKPPSGRPSCPRWLDQDARNAWRLLVTDLDAVGLVTKLDRNALTQYCRLFGRWMRAEKFLQEHGTTFPVRKVVKEEDGTEKVIAVGFQSFPQVREADALVGQLIRLGDRFGLTPSARASLQTSVEKKQDDGKARFFNKQEA